MLKYLCENLLEDQKLILMATFSDKKTRKRERFKFIMNVTETFAIFIRCIYYFFKNIVIFYLNTLPSFGNFPCFVPILTYSYRKCILGKNLQDHTFLKLKIGYFLLW